MEELPLVTILMPVYNGEKYLNEAIDSILAQTFRDFELLIINDGSTDNTQNIIETYDDRRIRTHIQKNKGVSRSLNQGISMIETPYIRRHDADDISEPWMLEEEMAFLKTHPDISFISTKCAFMTDKSKVAADFTQPKKKLFNNKEYILAHRSQFNPYSPIVHGTVLGPTKIFKEMGGYRTEFLTSEDNDLWLRIIEKYKFAILNKTSYYLRLSSNSATKTHKSSLTFYRELANQFAEDRELYGADLLQKGETIPAPKVENIVPFTNSNAGKVFRDDLLDFQYKLMINAKDYKNILKIVNTSLKDGWKLSRTWKALIFPLIGKKLVDTGVAIKRRLK